MPESRFSPAEYAGRLARTRARVERAGADLLCVTDPANIYYLTGYDACSFYAPQALFVPRAGEPSLFVREMDATSAWQTTVLTAGQVHGYPERFVQQRDGHPMDWIGAHLRERLDPGCVVAVESESPFYTLRAHRALVAALGPEVEVADTLQIVNWVRAVKSSAEIEIMRAAGRITERAVTLARDVIGPDVRQCDAVAEIYAELIRGLPDAGGGYTAIPPLVLAGANAAYPHVPWSDEPFGEGAVALELAGARHRYHAPLARTLYLGTPPARMGQLAEVTGEGLEAALAAIRPGAVCEDPALAWTEVIARHGFTKSSRVGYPVGIGFPPDWGEQTMSFRAGDRTPLEAGMTWHVMIGMWLDGWGYSISETVLVTESGAESLSRVPRGLLRVG